MKKGIDNINIISFLIFAIFFHVVSQGQILATSKQTSPYTYIYPVKPCDVRKLLKNSNHSFPEKLLQLPVDSFPTDSLYKKKLPTGHYLYVKAVSNQVNAVLVSINTIQVQALNHNRDLNLFIHHMGDSLPIPDAKVTINNKTIPYHPATGTYVLRRSNKTGLLCVETPGETAFFLLESDYPYSGINSTIRNISHSFPLKYLIYPFRKAHYAVKYHTPLFEKRWDLTHKVKGYLAFSQPKYLPNDTLKWKAFITNKRGKPYKKPLMMLLSTYDNQYTEFCDTLISPTTNGAYFQELPLGDSLKVNRRYRVELAHPRSQKTLISNDFYLEDYQLNETSYQIHTEKPKYCFNEPINLYLSGKDANDLPVLDSRVTVTLYPDRFSSYYDDEVFVPDVVWKTTQKLDPIGETCIHIPDSLLPAINAQFRIEALFNNSNNESHLEKVFFLFDGRKNRVELTLQNDSIFARYMDQGQSVSMPGILIGFSNSDTLINKPIQFPYKGELNPQWSAYHFIHGDICNEFELGNQDSQFQCYVNQLYDTLHIQFENPRKLPIRYTITQNSHQIIREGLTINLDEKITAPHNQSYTVSWNYVWGGRTISNTQVTYAFTKNLHVNIDQPLLIVPGEKTDVVVKVTDIDNNPVENVNITAGAINGQFKESAIPDVPYLGKWPKEPGGLKYFDVENTAFFARKKLNREWISKMNLNTIPYYQLTFPISSQYFYDTTANIHNSQFSPFLYHDGMQEPIVLIYVDDQLIYYNQTELPPEYSFMADTGYHCIRLRTKNREIEIDSVHFFAHSKLDFSLNLENLPPEVKVKKMPDQLTKKEVEQLSQHLIFIKNTFRRNLAFLWQKERVIHFAPHQKRIDLYTLGPFDHDSIHFVITNGFQTHFIFEPGYEYTINDGLIKMVRKNPFHDKHRLYSTSKAKQPGQIIHPIPIVYSTPKSNWKEALLPDYPTRTSKGNGTLNIDYQGDSIIYFIRISSLNKGIASRIYKNDQCTYFDLYPGWYQVTLITHQDEGILLDSVLIQPDGTNYRRFGDDELSITHEVEFPATHQIVDQSILYSYVNSTGDGSVKGKIFDFETAEPVPFASIILYSNGRQVGGAISDFDGHYMITNLPEGNYEMKVMFVGYKTAVLNNIYIKHQKLLYCDVGIEATYQALECVEVVDYCIPMISKDQTASGAVVTAGMISRMSGVVAGVTTNIRGTRSNESAFFIDGVQVTNLPPPMEQASTFDDESINQASQNGLRTNFKDCAYWQPNLITNEDGEVKFQVTFPDNITSWKTYALAMDAKKHSGVGLLQSKSYKPLMGQLATPRFLLQGDQTQVIGKVSNHAAKTEKVSISFELNDHLISTTDTTVENTFIQHFPMVAENIDSLHMTYLVRNQYNYMDGEVRNIPVYPIGMEEIKGTFHVLESDTTLKITVDTNDYPTTIHAQANTLEPLLDELKSLEDYPYFCNEQAASKLVGLLLEKKIQNYLNEPFRKDKQIRKLINRLKSGQNDDGGWGWWPQGTSGIWMTAYVTEALFRARLNGFEVDDLDRAISYLTWHLDVAEGNELLVSINTLSEMNQEIPLSTFLKEIHKDILTEYQQLMVLKIKQSYHLPYSLEPLLSSVKKTMFGNYYWGTSNYGWYQRRNNLTLLAYQIIEREDSLHPYLPKIRNYFLETKGECPWQNTIDKAKIVTTILPGILRESGAAGGSASVTFSGAFNTTVDNFPFTKEILRPENDIVIHKSGQGNIYLTTYQKRRNNSPMASDSLFEIKTWFEKDGIRTDTLIAGQPVELKINLTMHKKGDYIMVEIPIPAGCSYGNNKHNTIREEVHREYFKHKTSIFCGHLHEGTYLFTIQLQPRFTGKYTLNPAKAELMYFPTFNGNNEISTTVIREADQTE